MIADSELEFNEISSSFSKMWPIFKSQEIRKDGVNYSGPPDRERIIEHYLNAGIKHYEPQCWVRHSDAGENIPLDWPHTLAALYRVRCNLFHGEKAMHSDNDRIIVASAFRVLGNFMAGSRILVNRSQLL